METPTVYNTADDILAENARRRALLATPPVYAKTGADGFMPFEVWARDYVKIKPKGGGKMVPFILNRPQRKLVAKLEELRAEGNGIRLILLKARQWGGSTCIQLYMAWMQIMLAEGLNSLIIAHQICASEEIRDMFRRMVEFYGVDPYDDDDDNRKPPLTLRKSGRSGATYRLMERDCKITVGTAERPDSSRGGDYNLVHLSEVGLWKKTKGKSPEDIVRSACSGVLVSRDTMIVLESTANGAGTYFHREYLAAKGGQSQFHALFIPWYEIESYQLPLDDPAAFAARLLERRDDTASTGRSESGAYHWYLWNNGATLEAINWYITERRKYSSHGCMAAEYPSDDVEAFVHSGERVFAPEGIEILRKNVTDPSATGDIDEEKGEFYHEKEGPMQVWHLPDLHTRLSGRYMVVVDVGGRGLRADWSVITVFDRRGVGEMPEIAAQWRGHVDHDILAAKAAAIGRLYGNALLVIESNTLETNDRDRDVDGQQAPFILRQLDDSYPNLYYRTTGNGSTRPGFHTNTATKPMVIGVLVKAVREGLYVERDSKAIEELIQYERKPNGSYGAYTGCHDDILMTRAIGLYVHQYELDPVKTLVSTGERSTPPNPRHSGNNFGFF